MLLRFLDRNCRATNMSYSMSVTCGVVWKRKKKNIIPLHTERKCHHRESVIVVMQMIWGFCWINGVKVMDCISADWLNNSLLISGDQPATRDTHSSRSETIMGTKARQLQEMDVMKELLQKPFLPRRGWMMGRVELLCVCVGLSLLLGHLCFAFISFTHPESSCDSDKRGWTRCNYDSRDTANHIYLFLIVFQVCFLASQSDSLMGELLVVTPTSQPFRNPDSLTEHQSFKSPHVMMK